MPKKLEGDLIVQGARIAVVASRFNDFLTSHMVEAAISSFQRLGGDRENLTIAYVPGSLELAVVGKKLAASGRFDAVICLGCIIRGATDHYDHVCEQTAQGIRQVGLETGVPCIFGVVTADTLEQAIDRSGGKMGNQGAKAVMAAVEMVNLMKQIDNDR